MPRGKLGSTPKKQTIRELALEVYDRTPIELARVHELKALAEAVLKASTDEDAERFGAELAHAVFRLERP